MQLILEHIGVSMYISIESREFLLLGFYDLFIYSYNPFMEKAATSLFLSSFMQHIGCGITYSQR
jgi:hypothetical protein